MEKMYVTSTSSELTVRLRDDGDFFLVTIEGDLVKPLYHGKDEEKANKVYDETVAMYEERRKAGIN